MHDKSILMTFGLAALLLMSCQSLGGLNIFNNASGEGPVSNHGPRSMFVSHQTNLQVDVDRPVQIETYHMSQNKLGTLEISVNGQPVNFEVPGGQTATVANGLATIQVLAGEETILANPVAARFPNPTWPVFITWTGRISGTYDLSLVVTDLAGQKSEPIIQRVEVR